MPTLQIAVLLYSSSDDSSVRVCASSIRKKCTLSVYRLACEAVSLLPDIVKNFVISSIQFYFVVRLAGGSVRRIVEIFIRLLLSGSQMQWF